MNNDATPAKPYIHRTTRYLTPEEDAAFLSMVVNGKCVPKPGEPFFVLLGRDVAAPLALRAWADERAGHDLDGDAEELAKKFAEYRLELHRPSLGSMWYTNSTVRKYDVPLGGYTVTGYGQDQHQGREVRQIVFAKVETGNPLAGHITVLPLAGWEKNFRPVSSLDEFVQIELDKKARDEGDDDLDAAPRTIKTAGKPKTAGNVALREEFDDEVEILARDLFDKEMIKRASRTRWAEASSVMRLKHLREAKNQQEF